MITARSLSDPGALDDVCRATARLRGLTLPAGFIDGIRAEIAKHQVPDERTMIDIVAAAFEPIWGTPNAGL